MQCFQVKILNLCKETLSFFLLKTPSLSQINCVKTRFLPHCPSKTSGWCQLLFLFFASLSSFLYFRLPYPGIIITCLSPFPRSIMPRAPRKGLCFPSLVFSCRKGGRGKSRKTRLGKFSPPRLLLLLSPSRLSFGISRA